MKLLAIIPARGGSKGLPGKNIKLLHGKPMIQYTIEAAQQVNQIDRIIVSTDSEEIADVARSLGIQVPELRPEYLATDNANIIDVINHVLSKLDEHQEHYDVIMLLQPTCPLRSVEDIERAIQIYEDKQADSLISINLVESGHPYYMYTLENEQPKPLLPIEPRASNRQDYPPVYIRNGAIYMVNRTVFHEKQSFYGEQLYSFTMPASRSVNVDSELDFYVASELMRSNANG